MAVQWMKAKPASRNELQLALEMAVEDLNRGNTPLTIKVAKLYGAHYRLPVGEDLYECPIAYAMVVMYACPEDAVAVFNAINKAWEHYKEGFKAETVNVEK